MVRRKATAPRWWVVVGTDGLAVSEGTVLADPLPDGLAAVEVDGPGEGRAWDAAARAWGDPLPLPDPTPAAPPAELVLAQLGVIAADDSKTVDERVAAILTVLATAAPTD